MTFADKILDFNAQLELTEDMPPGIEVMNPFRKPEIQETTSLFYHKFYDDNQARRLILGINPGRFGAGVTGIPFTDTKRLQQDCGITIHGIETHEPSSVFIYSMINAYGGPALFYRKFYIGAVCPLGFTKKADNGKSLNYNYYDSKPLMKAASGFILDSMNKQLEFGIQSDICICLGGGKNFEYLTMLNQKHHFFKKIIPLEHPRYIMQYKARQVDLYIQKYLDALRD